MSSITEGDLRRSAVEAFGCPFRYQQIHLKGVDDTGDESVRGRVFHAAAWIYVLLLVAHETDADHDLAKQALRDGMATTGCPDQLVAPVERLFNRFAANFELDLGAYLQAEELVRRGRRTFRPDLVYARPHELEMKDWKTYYKGLTEKQAREELQTRWYVVEARHAWPGFKHYRFTYVFVRLGYEVSVVFTDEEIDAMEAGVQGSIDAVVQAEAKGEFPALPGSHCSLCRLACPVVDAPERTPIRVTSADDALATFGQILTLEQRLKVLKKNLGAFVKVEGPIMLRGERYDYVARDSTRFPLDAVFAETTLDQHPLIQVSPTSLKAVWKKTADIPKALQDTAIVKRGWSFTHKKFGTDHPDGLVDVLADGDEQGDGDESED